MNSDNVNPKEESRNINDYETLVADKKSFLKNNVKLLPSGEKKNFKETTKSIELMWKIGEVRAHIINNLESIHKKFLEKEKVNINQNLITTQIIGKDCEKVNLGEKKSEIIFPINLK